MRIRHLVVLLSVASLVALSPAPAAELDKASKTILEKATEIEVFSIDPSRDKEKGKDTFHGYTVLGKTTVKDADLRKKIVEELEDGIKKPNPAADCFIPRHGIRAKHDGKTVDLVICFQCSGMRINVNDKAIEGEFGTNKLLHTTLNKILKDAGVKLAPTKEE